jgi:general secretion pathway protein G
MIIDYKKQDGFTLIEIMVVLIIIAIMASFVVPSVINRPDQARFTKVKNDILTIESALDLYKLDNGNLSFK